MPRSSLKEFAWAKAISSSCIRTAYAEDSTGTPLGPERLAAWIQRHAELDAYADGQGLTDDCTILAVKAL